MPPFVHLQIQWYHSENMIRVIELENFRSFKGKHRIVLKPLTLLVGENSTGKSSLLGALSTARNPSIPNLEDLNQDPYRFAGFRSLVSDNEKHYSIGFHTTLRLEHLKDNLWITIRQSLTASRSIETEYEFRIDGIVYIIAKKNQLLIRFANKERVLIGDNDDECIEIPFDRNDDHKWYWVHTMSWMLQDIADKYSNRLSQSHRDALKAFYNYVGTQLNVISISPIRSKPQRHYEGTSSGRTPEGDYIPHRLREALKSNDKDNPINVFGIESGLFRNLRAHELKTASGDTFELTVRSMGAIRTLVDVGYGVSQVLPVVTDVALAASPTVFLIQQPEVHLHPKSQAQLGTFFVKQCKNGHQFIIETHSDYMLDRLRVEVARKSISCEDISILYLEAKGNATHVTDISLDERGNFVNAPANFRDFFLQEQKSLLGWD